MKILKRVLAVTVLVLAVLIISYLFTGGVMRKVHIALCILITASFVALLNRGKIHLRYVGVNFSCSLELSRTIEVALVLGVRFFNQCAPSACKQ